MGSAVVVVGVAGLLAAPPVEALGGSPGPAVLWISPPLGAAVALLLATPMIERPRLTRFLALHGWALLSGLAAGWLARQLELDAHPTAGALGLALLAGAVAGLQTLAGWLLAVRHPPAQATALLVLLSSPSAGETWALVAGLSICGALACPWFSERG